MSFVIGLFTSRLTGPIATVACLILMFALLGQCQATGSAKRSLAKSEARVVALSRDLDTCHGNVATLDGARKAQNAALEARSAEDAQRLAQAGKDLSSALRGREKAEARAAQLVKAGPVGVDACARAIDAFETVKEQAR